MENFATLKKNLRNDFSAFPRITAFLLGDTATQLLEQAIRGEGYAHGLDIRIPETGFNRIDALIFDPGSELYASDPDWILLFFSTHKLLGKFAAVPQREEFARETCDAILERIRRIRSRSRARILLYNFPEIDDAVFGNLGAKHAGSFLFQLRKLNYLIQEATQADPDLFLCDLSSIQNRMGRDRTFSPAIYVNTEMVIGIDALPAVARSTVSVIAAVRGQQRKCLVLDLDNTLWGGVIGDDGIENIQIGSLGIGKAFTELQQWIRKLKERGIILAVCSKNTESVAKEPFEKHPDMVLRLSDIALFVANWENKADNIARIRETLNIGYDSMVFLDDNPFERNMVRSRIPAVCVPELPEDPAAWLEYLYALDLFETVSVSAEDAARTRLYQIEAQRTADRLEFTDEASFLQSLGMRAGVSGLDDFNIPRVAQLSQRSNQFNLRTVRYTEEELRDRNGSDRFVPFAFTLEDKYGDNGLISVVVLRKDSPDTLFIENWFMSCRVLKRGMEWFVLNTLVRYARENGYRTLRGEYLPTPKNALVAHHYADLGFQYADSCWSLDVPRFTPASCFIETK